MSWFDKIKKSLSTLFSKDVNENMDEVQLDEALVKIVNSGGIVTKAAFDEEMKKQNEIISGLKAELEEAKKSNASDTNLSDLKSEFSQKLDTIISENKALKEEISNLKKETGEEMNYVKTLLSSREGSEGEGLGLKKPKSDETVKEVKADFLDNFLSASISAPFSGK